MVLVSSVLPGAPRQVAPWQARCAHYAQHPIPPSVLELTLVMKALVKKALVMKQHLLSSATNVKTVFKLVLTGGMQFECCHMPLFCWKLAGPLSKGLTSPRCQGTMKLDGMLHLPCCMHFQDVVHVKNLHRINVCRMFDGMQLVWEATSWRAAVVSSAPSGPTLRQVQPLARHAHWAAQQQGPEQLAPTTAHASVSYPLPLAFSSGSKPRTHITLHVFKPCCHIRFTPTGLRQQSALA